MLHLRMIYDAMNIEIEIKFDESKGEQIFSISFNCVF